MIDLEAILQQFVETARRALDGQISEMGPPDDRFPAIIKARSKGPTPSFPYGMVDYYSTTDNGEWKLQEYLDDGDIVYQSNKYVLIGYTLYGKNALQLADNLKGCFRVGSVLDEIINNTGGGRIINVFEANRTPYAVADDLPESATLNINFGITDTLTIPDTGENYFTMIELNGVLYPPGSDTLLDLVVTAP